MANLKEEGRVATDSICLWLAHHDEYLSKAAADALRNYENEWAEHHLLSLVHDHSEAREAGRHDHRQRTAVKALKSLLTWDRVGDRTMAMAVNRLLRIPKRAFHAGGDPEGPNGPAQRATLKTCTRECARSCNPHEHLTHCKVHQ